MDRFEKFCGFIVACQLRKQRGIIGHRGGIIRIRIEVGLELLRRFVKTLGLVKLVSPGLGSRSVLRERWRDGAPEKEQSDKYSFFHFELSLVNCTSS